MKLLVVLGVVLLACAAFGGRVPIPEEIDTKVVGGQGAARDQFPFIVSMIWCLLPGLLCQHICGGTILTPNRVVTAAHCITETPSLGSFSVRGGFLLQNDAASIGQQISVASSVVHPNYQGGVNPNDIAILNLAASFQISASIQTAALPVFQDIPSGTAGLVGWGSTSNTAQQIMPNQLQFIAAKPLLTIAQCAQALTSVIGNSGPLADTNVCTGGTGLSACSGDSGGPLFQGTNTLIGIVSWGIIPCATFNAPSVYTRTSAFNPWIQSLV